MSMVKEKEILLENVSSGELLKEIEKRFKEGVINRRTLLKLANINGCLECGKDEKKIENNGYCRNCNNSHVV